MATIADMSTTRTPRTAKPTSTTPTSGKAMSDGQRAYEERRAQKAGLSLDKHLVAKERRAAAEAKKAAPPPVPKRKGVLSRLLDRARRPM